MLFKKSNVLRITAIAGIAVVLLLSQAVVAQTGAPFAGTWTWNSRPNRQRESTMFSLDIKQKANRISGQIWFGMTVDGENDGSDSSFVPFVGTVNGNTAIIEFDPSDIRSIDDENVRYRKPRSAARATLELRNGKLHWNDARGSLDRIGVGPLRSMLMTRER